jgi:hypothetical protein
MLSSPPNGENLRFFISGLAHLRNFRICGLIQKNSGFAICRLAHTKNRNLRICDSGINPKIYGFAIADRNIICVPTFTVGLLIEKLKRNKKI